MKRFNNLSKIQFTMVDIQVGVGNHEFDKAFILYKKKTVNHIKEDSWGYSAIVSGTHNYEVSVSETSYGLFLQKILPVL